MFRSSLLIVACLIAVISTDAQIKRRIKKGSRNKSQSDFALEKGDIEVDWVLGYETVTAELDLVYPNLGIRYGITDRLEINAGISTISVWDRSVLPKNHLSGLEPLGFGINYQFSEEGEGRTSIVLSGQLAIPYFATNHFTADRYAPVLQLIVNKPVGDRHNFGSSVGLFWDGFAAAPSFIYDVNYTNHLNSKWDVTVDVFGFVNGGPSQHTLDLTANYNYSNMFQYGLTAGVGLTPASPRFYTALSGVWTMNTLKKKKQG